MKRNTHPFAPSNWLLWLSFGLLRLVMLLPYPVILRLGEWQGLLLYRLAKRRVRIVRTNLGLCFPQLTEVEREALVRDCFIANGKGLMEIGMSWWLPDSRLRGLVEVQGLEHLPEDGQGCILLSAHFSTLELGGRFLSWHKGFHAVYRPHENPVIEHFFRTHRARYGGTPIPRQEVRTMVKALREAQAIWLAPDQRLNRKGSEMVNFFGIPCITSTVTGRLAHTGKAQVLPYFLYRKPDGRGYVLRIEPLLEGFPSKDILADTQRVNDVIERWVRLAPAEYNWMHRRFKNGGINRDIRYR